MSDETKILLNVRGEPKGQPRPRAFVAGGKARVFDPGTAEAWKSAIASAFKGALPLQPWTCPVHLAIAFRFRRPKDHFRIHGDLKPGVPTWKAGRPDADNLAKAVMDALTHVGLFRDDSQVVMLRVDKLYGEPEGATILVMPAGEHKEADVC